MNSNNSMYKNQNFEPERISHLTKGVRIRGGIRRGGGASVGENGK